MSAMLKEQLVKVFSSMKPGLLFQYGPELDTYLDFLIWRFSIWVYKPTPGNAVMNLRYRDERAAPIAGKEAGISWAAEHSPNDPACHLPSNWVRHGPVCLRLLLVTVRWYELSACSRLRCGPFVGSVRVLWDSHVARVLRFAQLGTAEIHGQVQVTRSSPSYGLELDCALQSIRRSAISEISRGHCVCRGTILLRGRQHGELLHVPWRNKLWKNRRLFRHAEIL